MLVSLELTITIFQFFLNPTAGFELFVVNATGIKSDVSEKIGKLPKNGEYGQPLCGIL